MFMRSQVVSFPKPELKYYEAPTPPQEKKSSAFSASDLEAAYNRRYGRKTVGLFEDFADPFEYFDSMFDRVALYEPTLPALPSKEKPVEASVKETAPVNKPYQKSWSSRPDFKTHDVDTLPTIQDASETALAKNADACAGYAEEMMGPEDTYLFLPLDSIEPFDFQSLWTDILAILGCITVFVALISTLRSQLFGPSARSLLWGRLVTFVNNLALLFRSVFRRTWRNFMIALSPISLHGCYI